MLLIFLFIDSQGRVSGIIIDGVEITLIIEYNEILIVFRTGMADMHPVFIAEHSFVFQKAFLADKENSFFITIFYACCTGSRIKYQGHQFFAVVPKRIN